MRISIQHLSFTYDGSYTPVFEDASAELDTSWRLALIGRNGRGKTTLLRLMLGRYPYQGRMDLPLPAAYFPYAVQDDSLCTCDVLRAAAPQAQDWQLERELSLLDVTPDALERPFCTLSRGERTKALLSVLFARDDVYPLIDEPTNHLDAYGRELVAQYLRRKDGFLLVSHDRAFLNRCVDHVMALNRSDIWVMRGNYDTWEQRFERQNAYEQAQNESLKRDIVRLEESARRAAAWSNRTEKGKYHVSESDVAAVDRGYVGARSAAMMKRAKATQKRRERAVEEKSCLLHNVERVGEVKLRTLSHPKQTLIRVSDARVRYGERAVCQGIAFELRQGDRLALVGRNGAGKSSVLKALCGLCDALEGEVSIAGGLTLSYVPQETDGVLGSMDAFVRQNALDETLLKAILRNMDFGRELFDAPLETLSQGQKKKILLAASLASPAHLYVWDEPLNYLDVFSRVQLERLIQRCAPTMLMVEHDQMFLSRVLNREPVRLGDA